MPRLCFIHCKSVTSYSIDVSLKSDRTNLHLFLTHGRQVTIRSAKAVVGNGIHNSFFILGTLLSSALAQLHTSTCNVTVMNCWPVGSKFESMRTEV